MQQRTMSTKSDKSLVASLTEAARLYPAPGNRRAYLQQPCDEKIVAARPDLKFHLYPATGGEPYYRTGFGFALRQGQHAVSFDFARMEQRFAMGCLPLLTQCVTQEGFRFVQESFTTRDAHGRGLVMLRLSVWRCGDTPDTVEVGWLATRAPYAQFASHPNEDYIEFEPWAPAWESPLPLTAEGSVLHDGEYITSYFRHSAGVTTVVADSMKPMHIVFRVAPRNAPETIEVIVPYECVSQPVGEDDRKLRYRPDAAFRVAERAQLDAISFDEERRRQVRAWSAQLARATRIEVPETAVQDVYRTLTLNNLQFLGSAPEVSWLKPGQGGFNDFACVYAWEASNYLIQMARQGYHDEVRRVLDYLLTTQHGHAGPEGEVSDVEGCFRPFIHWMNETGAVLTIFASYCFASGDTDRLRCDAEALLAAARWMQRQRNHTRELLADGSRAPHYGLMPKGRPHDWPIYGHFLFTDVFLWQGLHQLAQAFDAAGLPDAAWLREEADEYRACILAATRQAIKPHPVDPTLSWVPSEIGEDPAEAIKTTVFCGPQALLTSGILDADDELIPVLEAMLRAAGCVSDHFGFKMRLMEDEELRRRQLSAAGGHVDLYYVTNMERAWHRHWLERGEREKAIAYFYLSLAYATSRDLHLVQERFCPQLPWLLPWQPNASGNGRILDMMLTNLCFITGDTAHLLYGAPDAWFAARTPLGIEGWWIQGGTWSFRLTPHADDAGWDFTYTCQGGQVPHRFLLSLPDSTGTGRVTKEILTQGKADGRVTVSAME